MEQKIINSMLNNTYLNKKVLVTGHTGFKGSWLTIWLLKMGAKVIGISKDIPSTPSMFNELGLENKITHYQADVRDLEGIRTIINNESPDFIFHLAAQAIVSISYADPIETFTTNTIGTMNVLEVLREYTKPCIMVMITSDKCYDNVEWIWGYKETDAVGGKDVYSGSKGAAELVIKSYQHSFFKKGHPVKLGIGRAGNVIGGGDWAKDRIVVDCMRSWSEGKTVKIRSPKATRPWQHVLEPLSGYLLLGAKLAAEEEFHGEAFNFGPRAEQNRTVVELLNEMSKYWGFEEENESFHITANIPFHEAGLLKLNCDKALFYLKWEPNLDYTETIRLVSKWYYSFYREKIDMYEFTINQINEYEKIANERKRIWSVQ
jgi:CDP-glucose 4,6-dehydratase